MKVRKKYQGPKYVAANPMATFMGGMSQQHAEHAQELKLKNHTALSNMARGVADRGDWDRLVGMINMANVMCQQGIGAEYGQQVIDGRKALLACGVRSTKIGKFIFTGDELRQVSDALDCHDAQIDNVRALDIDRAAKEVQRRLRHKIGSTSVKAELAKTKIEAPN